EAVTVAVAITFGKASQGDAASIKRGAIDGQDRSRGLRAKEEPEMEEVEMEEFDSP
ncbi:unnamed protein product, partial [Effrenium voratum]